MAHDIAQDTWLALRVPNYRDKGPTELLKLGFKIARYLYLHRREKGSRETAPPEDWNPAAAGINTDERIFRDQIRRACETLTGKCPELLLLMLEGFTADEIRVKMGAGRTGTVHVWTHRCIQALREKIGMGGKK